MLSDYEIALLAAKVYEEATITHEDLGARVDVVDGTFYVSCRGTVPKSVENWLRDFASWPHFMTGLGIMPHGFASGAIALDPLIGAEIKQGSPIVLTGHSLGGALALDLGAMWTLSRRNVARIVTFGAPRAGSETTAEVLHAVPIAQYHHGNDPVPDVPLLYKHMREPLIAFGQPTIDPIQSHFMNGYLTELKART